MNDFGSFYSGKVVGTATVMCLNMLKFDKIDIDKLYYFINRKIIA